LRSAGKYLDVACREELHLRDNDVEEILMPVRWRNGYADALTELVARPSGNFIRASVSKVVFAEGNRPTRFAKKSVAISPRRRINSSTGAEM
jgi:hypothetical protein